jgi:hypothetical protein
MIKNNKCEIVVGSEFQLMASFYGGRTPHFHSTLFRLGQHRKPRTTFINSAWLKTNELYAYGVGRTRFLSSKAVPSVTQTWVDRLPPKVRPYAYLTRIDKPIGTLLLFYPCGAPMFRRKCLIGITFPYSAWSITMASYALHLPITTPLTYISLFGLGALVMRGAGCTINDMWDKNLDKAVGELSATRILIRSLLIAPGLVRSQNPG